MRMNMEREPNDPSDRCVHERCWTGPMLIVGTEKGAIGDLRTSLKVMLSKFHDKATTLAMMSCLTFTHVHEERTILAFAIGREPHATVLRHIYALVKLHHDGKLRTYCATYRFGMEGDGEREFCDHLVAHLGWLTGLARLAQR